MGPLFSSSGYVFEEYFLSGAANLYDRANEVSFELVLQRPSVPYTNRIQVLRPTDKSKFSGVVFVEIGHTSDNLSNFVTLHDLIIERGDAFVGVTAVPRPSTHAEMKAFNPQRYAKLTWPATSLADPEGDVGYVYDMLSQVGALLKGQDPKSPLAGYGVKYLYMGGASRTGGMAGTYLHFFHPRAFLSNGKYVYDGFLIGIAAGGSFINNAHSRWSVEGRQLRGTAPTIVVLSEMEVGTLNGTSLVSLRRPNSDVLGDQFRLYEVPGTIHGPLTGPPENYRTTMKETPPNDNPARGYVHRASYINLDRWVRDGTPPPRVDPIEVKNPLGRDPVSTIFRWGETVRDEFGNARGGVRHPWVDAPIATYTTWYTPGSADLQARTGFFLYGYKRPFSYDQLQKVYGAHDTYAQRVAESADRMVRDRLLLAKDAELIKKLARDSNVLVGPPPAVVPTPVPTPKLVITRPASAPRLPAGWASVRQEVGYQDRIDYYVPVQASLMEMPPATALAVFHGLPGIELKKIDLPAGTTNAQLRDRVKNEKLYSSDLVGPSIKVTEEGDLTLDDGTSSVSLTYLADHVRGWFFKITSVFYVMGNTGYILTAYDHTYKEGETTPTIQQILKSLHRTLT